jgi:hypothetical protein
MLALVAGACHGNAGGTTFAIFSFTPFSLLSQNGVAALQ